MSKTSESSSGKGRTDPTKEKAAQQAAAAKREGRDDLAENPAKWRSFPLKAPDRNWRSTARAGRAADLQLRRFVPLRPCIPLRGGAVRNVRS